MADKRRRPANRRVTFYQQNSSAAANTDGSFDESATEYCTRWVTAFPLNGREQPAMEHQQPTVEWIVKLRKDAATKEISPAMWIVFPGGERLNITSVFDPDGRNRELEIRAKQVA